MRPHSSSLARSLFASYLLILLLAGLADAQTAQFMPVQPRITRAVDEAQLATLKGNTHPLARAQFDRGAAAPTLALERMLLVLKRSPEQEAALITLLDQQQDKSSPNYHKWLTPEEFGKRFGPADADLQTVTGWLQGHGFQVTQISKGRTVIEFSGTAAMVEEAFHTQIHRYVVKGESHWANASDPQIPDALIPVVAGVWTMHNFLKQPQVHLAQDRMEAQVRPGPLRAEFTAGNGLHALVPADYYTIYNIMPRFGTSGSIGIVARSNINTQDVTYFHYWTFDQAPQPTVIVNGPDPGDLGGGEEVEAVLDTTWSGAVDPSANVYLVVSASTNTTDGADLSELYIVDNNLTDVMSESFGSCEAGVTSAQAAAMSSVAQQAAAQGITYVVSTGDSGSAGCDAPTQTQATHPPSVNVLAANPYVIAVGGTMFNENTRSSSYWSSTNNPSTLGSALSYIPENVWNESCTGTKCGSNNPNLWAGGGGSSTLYLKADWQFGVAGIPSDNARHLPDVSLTAAGHDPYLLCVAGSCVPDSQGRIFFAAVSGTSASAPAFAGIMAMVGGATGSRQGQANYVLYRLAAAQTLSQCNASNTSTPPASACVFNDVTVGNNAVPGETGYGTSSAPYQSTVGYDLATGLGSVNVNNLVSQWNSVTFQGTQTTFSITPQTAVHGAPLAVTMNVSALSGHAIPTGSVWLQGGPAHGNLIGDSTQQTFALDASGSVSATTHLLVGGVYTVNAHYPGDGTFGPSDSAPPIMLTIQPEPSTTTISALAPDGSGNLVPFTSGTYGSPIYLKAHVAGQSGYGSPTAYVNFWDTSGAGISSAQLDPNGDGLSPAITTLGVGPHSITGGYYGDASFSSSVSAAVNVTLSKASTTTSVQSSAATVAAGSPVTLTATVDTSGKGNAPTGNVIFSAGGTSLSGNVPLSASINSTTGTAQGIATYQATLPNGPSTITAQYTDDANYTGSTSSAITVTVAPDFSLAFTGSSGAVMTLAAPGSSGTLTPSVSGQNYTGTVNFAASACAGLPFGATCSFNPASVTGVGSTTLTVMTTAPHVSVPAGLQARIFRFAGGSLSLVGVFLLATPRRRRLWASLLGLALLAGLLTLSGCGGSGGGGGGTPGTPPGIYNVTVTGKDANFSHPVTFTLNVQ